MADGWEALVALLPCELSDALRRLPKTVTERVQELRLRAGQAVAVGVRGEEHYVTAGGALTARTEVALCCKEGWLRSVVDRVCEHSVYAHEEEIKRGFLPAPRGCRIGIAGTAVVENGVVVGYRGITSLCMRVARDHCGCAGTLAQVLCRNGVSGALIGGEPSSGKTAILRDLLREFSARRLSVAVVDERSELTGGGVFGCDVLRGSPKAVGIEQAIRCLSPRVVVFDELGGADEVQAVRQALHCGVPVVASVHCREARELLWRDGLYDALHGGAFPYVVQLRGAAAPGEIAAILRTEEWLDEVAGCGTGVPDRGRLWRGRVSFADAAGGFTGTADTLF